MAEIKEMAYGILVILVSINAVSEFVAADPVLREATGLGVIHDFNSTTILTSLENVETSSESIIESDKRTDLLGALSTMISSFGGALGGFPGIISFVFRLVFGWSLILTAIFVGVGIPELAIVFVAPIAIIEALCIFYLLRDLAGVIRGVS